MSWIKIYADETDRDLWEDYCDACNVPYSATSIKIYFDNKKVEYDEEAD